MSNISNMERRKFEQLLEMGGGYVLDFSGLYQRDRSTLAGLPMPRLSGPTNIAMTAVCQCLLFNYNGPESRRSGEREAETSFRNAPASVIAGNCGSVRKRQHAVR